MALVNNLSRYVDEEMVRRGATVFTGTLLPGDTIYIPTGAMHGGLNLPGEAAVAITGNYIDRVHAPQIFAHYCKNNNKGVRETRTDMDAASRNGPCRVAYNASTTPHAPRLFAALVWGWAPCHCHPLLARCQSCL